MSGRDTISSSGHPGPVVVDEAVAGVGDAPAAPDVGGLARVLLEVGPLDADPVPRRQLELAVGVDGQVVLADLVVLRHVGIEVVLPGEHRPPHVAPERPPEAHGQLDHLLVEHRQRSRQAEADRAHVGVGLVAEPVRATAEQLGRRRQLGVDLEPDDRLPGGRHAPRLEPVGGPTRTRSGLPTPRSHTACCRPAWLGGEAGQLDAGRGVGPGVALASDRAQHVAEPPHGVRPRGDLPPRACGAGPTRAPRRGSRRGGRNPTRS